MVTTAVADHYRYGAEPQPDALNFNTGFPVGIGENPSPLTPDHAKHLEKELGGADGLAAAIRYGARSLTAAEADAAGFRLFDRDGRRQVSAGILLPFAEGFAQLRCDCPPLNRRGEPAKYLNRSGAAQGPATFGDGPPILATEGWKDALRLHLETGLTVQAIAGVTGWRSLAPSVEILVYDADAAINPHVWSQLLAAGAARRDLRLALFSGETAGPKGGAVEHFSRGGSWPIQTRTARELLTFIASQLPKGLRCDWITPTLRNLAAASYRLGGDDTAAETIAVTAAKRLGVRVGQARGAVGRIQRRRGLEAASGGGSRLKLKPDEVVKALPQHLGAIRLDVRSGDVVTEKRGILNGNQISRLYLELSNQVETWPKEATTDAVLLYANGSKFDPVEEYLSGIDCDPLPLDQWQRLDHHLLGIDDPIARTFLPRYLISAVARTMEPGCYVRQTPVLIGPQERGKTELGRVLFGPQNWTEGVGTLDRDALQRAGTAWGVELAELDGVTRRRDQEQLKAFLTETADTYRVPYDRAPETHPRRFVFWGTANRPPLRDSSGSTRFVIIPIPDRMLPLDWARQHRDAIWRRALEQFRAGVTWLRTDEEERQVVEARNAEFLELDPWAEPVAAYLAHAQHEQALPVAVPKVLTHLGVPVERHNNAAAKRVLEIAERLGWQHGRRRQGEKRPQGLWPLGHPGHPGHPTDTPVDTPADQLQRNESASLGHPGHPNSSKGSEEKGEQGGEGSEQGEQEPGGGEGVGVSGCPGCPLPQTHCAASGFGVSTGVSTGVSGVSTGVSTGVSGVSGVSTGWPPGKPLQTAPRTDAGFAIRVDGQPGWRQITRGSGSGSVLCTDPAGASRQISRKRITPELAA